MAAPAGEDAAAIEDRYPPTAADGRTNEPVTRAAQIARRSFKAHGGTVRPSILPRHSGADKSGSRGQVRPASESTPLVRRRASTASSPGSRASVLLRARSAAHPRCGNLPSSTSRRTAIGSRYLTRPLDFPVINLLTDVTHDAAESAGSLAPSAFAPVSRVFKLLASNTRNSPAISSRMASSKPSFALTDGYFSRST
jgi:hypothetical protein